MEQWYRLVTLKHDSTENLDIILDRAEEFHGHLGPFLVLGVRMSIIAARELGTKVDNKELCATAMVRDSPPFSCVIDGIQVTTKCTIGNKKLRLKNSSEIATKFELPSGEEVTVAVNSTVLNKLKKELLSKTATDEELRKLAHLVASMPDDEVFIIRTK
jgi:formylmethanofuran dehydrogenase subunit E